MPFHFVRFHCRIVSRGHAIVGLCHVVTTVSESEAPVARRARFWARSAEGGRRGKGAPRLRRAEDVLKARRRRAQSAPQASPALAKSYFVKHVIDYY